MTKENELYLIFVNKIGSDVYGKSLYEFVFSNGIKNINGENWDSYPAGGNPQPPHAKFIDDVGSVKTGKLELDVIQESGFFGMSDAIDGVIALSWEIPNEYDDDDEKRLIFHFGELEGSVMDKLYAKDIMLENMNKTGGL